MATRRDVLSAITAGAAALPAAGVASGRAPATEPMGPNDRKLFDMLAEWRAVCERQRELNAARDRIEASLPAELQGPSPDFLGQASRAAHAGADEATVERLREAHWDFMRRKNEAMRVRGADAIDAEHERLSDRRMALENGIGDTPPDTEAGLRVHLTILDSEYPSDTERARFDGMADEPWKTAAHQTPEGVVANIIQYARKVAGGAA
jgi:hypothetical protein